jgi:hypothetical protein
MPAPLSATQLRPRSSSAVAATAAGDATVTQERYPETSARQKIRCGEGHEEPVVLASSAQIRKDAELGQHSQSIGCATKLGHPAVSDS